jgi:hypothetical protein
LYVANDTNKLYRWSGTAYVEVSASQASSWGSITGNLASQVDLQGELDNKVNTESGKGLSTNDYTTTEKNKLAGIAAGAEVNVNADWNATSGDAQILNKPTIPSIAGLATTSYVDSQDATKQDVLVSGTNIKTINGATVLGSGDITIGGSGVTNVTGTSPISSSGGTTPDISIPQANVATDGYLSLIDYQYFSTKQEELVSGTNIKTINSTSVLGSGNIAVQPTLVSGTNIKTINGNSVLGSGDLTISGGGGGAGIHLRMPQGYKYTNHQINLFWNGSTTQVQNSTGGQIRFVPFYPTNEFICNKFDIGVTTGVAGATFRFVIYSDNSGVPLNKLYESANIDASTVATKNIITNFTFSAGTVYWLAIHSSANGIGFSGCSQLSLYPLYVNGGTIYNGILTGAYAYASGSPATIVPATALFFGSSGAIQVTMWKQ